MSCDDKKGASLAKDLLDHEITPLLLRKWSVLRASRFFHRITGATTPPRRTPTPLAPDVCTIGSETETDKETGIALPGAVSNRCCMKALADTFSRVYISEGIRLISSPYSEITYCQDTPDIISRETLDCGLTGCYFHLATLENALLVLFAQRKYRQKRKVVTAFLLPRTRWETRQHFLLSSWS